MSEEKILEDVRGAMSILYRGQRMPTVTKLQHNVTSLYLSADVKKYSREDIQKLREFGFVPDHCNFKYTKSLR